MGPAHHIGWLVGFWWACLAAAITLATAGVQSAPLPYAADTAEQRLSPLLTGMEKHATQFRRSLAHTPDREWTVGPAKGRNIDYFAGRFVDAIRRLRTDAARGPASPARVDDVLRLGVSIDSFMDRHPGANQASRDWATVRHDLEALALTFDVPWNQAMTRVTSVRLDLPLGGA
jgi:broad specificity phosphatase PhoE